jgi:hypothetical protein
VSAARALLLLPLLLGASAQAHMASSGFLALRVEDRTVTGSIELAVRDIELGVGLDDDTDGRITWAELRQHRAELVAYVLSNLSLRDGTDPCSLSAGQLAVNDRVDGPYAWLALSGRCPQPVRELVIDYRVLTDIDPSHRGLLTLVSRFGTQTAVLGGRTASTGLSLEAPSRWRAFLEYLQAGVWHILSGIDHLLFLLSLLLPAVLLRRHGAWEPVREARTVFGEVLRVVTAFTLAHSITLTLAALDVLRLPSRLTESVIAASISIAALNNLFPLISERRARIAFAFGLLHGFGFASVLADMGLPSGARVLSLFAFNLGIEAGQLAVVLLVLPLIYRARIEPVYRRALMPLGSAAIAVAGLVWLTQRALL